MKFKKGFTLIELLVVIAIIGLLTSIALASLKSARDKAADATIKQNLAQIRAQAEIVYDNSGNAESYAGIFDFGSAGLQIFLAAYVVAGNCPGCAGYYQAMAGGGNPSTWAAWVQLKTDPDNAWCVDYLGSSRKVLKSSVSNLIAPNPCPAGI